MIAGTIDRVRDYFKKRAIAYTKVFDPQNQFTETVLMDLARFCRAHDSTFHSDSRAHAVMEGRREVWLRIQKYLRLDIEEIYRLHKVREYEEIKE